MRYKSGMKVVFLHHSGGGIVQEILENGRVSILDEDGFTHAYPTSQIAPVYSEEYFVEEDDLELIIRQDNNIDPRKLKSIQAEKRKNNSVPEIDLHIEELTDSHRGLSNYEILSQQMIAFRQFYNKARSNRTRKIVIIHGVGEGVLRYEIRSFLNKENGVEYFDANYSDYGQGATMIELFGSGN